MLSIFMLIKLTVHILLYVLPVLVQIMMVITFQTHI